MLSDLRYQINVVPCHGNVLTNDLEYHFGYVVFTIEVQRAIRDELVPYLVVVAKVMVPLNNRETILGLLDRHVEVRPQAQRVAHVVPIERSSQRRQ